MSEEKKTHPEHKYSVTFVPKVGTIIVCWFHKLLRILLISCEFGKIICFASNCERYSVLTICLFVCWIQNSNEDKKILLMRILQKTNANFVYNLQNTQFGFVMYPRQKLSRNLSLASWCIHAKNCLLIKNWLFSELKNIKISKNLNWLVQFDL